ncbi:hypothetical protein ZWY2020_049098 [Hordeum vulgare]|nr:hypothetical protein ZWY2020_049098 [Hordeum vulgare]
MEYEAGLVVSGPMTQLEADIWIQTMENHFGNNLISRKYEVEHALRYFTQSAAIWWKMNHAIQGFSGAETWDECKRTLLRSRLIQKCYDYPKEKTCACKICGEIGHTQEEHKDGCTHCEENHPAEECPSSQVTCFLCEGTTHYPAQCHIYPKVQQVVKQQKDAVKETLKKKILEEPVMNKNIEDPDGQEDHLLPPLSLTSQEVSFHGEENPHLRDSRNPFPPSASRRLYKKPLVLLVPFPLKSSPLLASNSCPTSPESSPETHRRTSQELSAPPPPPPFGHLSPPLRPLNRRPLATLSPPHLHRPLLPYSPIPIAIASSTAALNLAPPVQPPLHFASLPSLQAHLHFAPLHHPPPAPHPHLATSTSTGAASQPR